MDGKLIKMTGIGKSFSGVTVLEGVNFELEPGEVHILAGENGAGKSTLMKIVAGVHTEYEGRFEFLGDEVRLSSPSDAASRGISVIHQEMSLIDSMSVIDNMFLGRELTHRYSGRQWMDHRDQALRAKEFCSQLGLDIDLTRPVEDYSLSVKNRIEIAKALAYNAKVIIMDEPTSALSEPEVDRLFLLIEDLKKRGCGIVYISHKMEEIYRIADRITVLRDGRTIGTAKAKDLPAPELIKWMIGRELSAQFPARKPFFGPERLKIENFSVPKPARTSTGEQQWLVRDVSLSVRAGEIVGVAGLQGSGNSELFSGIFGFYGSSCKGTVSVEGKAFRVHSPRKSIQQGMAHLTNDRKGNGLVLGMSVANNISLASLKAISKAGWLLGKKEKQTAERQVAALRVRTSSLDQTVGTLSGGNQQKVVLGKWIETEPKVLLLDEPTRGVDVGAKHEIYELMNEWTAKGYAILMITSEMPELLGVADRIVVMHRGQVTAEFTREEATQEKILQAAMGEKS